MARIFKYAVFFVALAALASAAIYSESFAQTKGKTPQQLCAEKFANMKGVAKNNVIQACVDDMNKSKGK